MSLKSKNFQSNVYLIFRLKFLLAFSEDFYTKKSGLNPIKYSKNQQKILPAVPQVQYNKRKEECMDNTPYDDVFRTLLTDCTELMIPVVNEIFHTKYTGKETICLLQNEHFIKMPDGSEQERITDSSFEIISEETAPIAQGQKKRYHIECQSTEDGSMIVRMFEYDTQLALENREFISNILTVQFPDSAIVSLRHTKNTPEEMTVKVLTPGGRVSYTVPVLKVKRYTIHELFERKLFFLIPFHIFAYEKDFKELEENKKKLKQLEAEYASIRERLEIACQMGDLNRYAKAAILDMSRKVIEHLAVKYKNVAKG